MKIGISTYAYRWEFSNKAEIPISLEAMLKKTSQFGAEVFQICDYPLIENYSLEELRRFKQKANEFGIELELGTQGVHPEHIRKYIEIADVLGASVLRTTIHGAGYLPTISEAITWLIDIEKELEISGVKIALETYEPIKSTDLVIIVKEVNSPNIGICLDPGNSISELEHPKDVVLNTIGYVTNLHVKDFIFKRGERKVGFELTGCPLGEGQLDLEFMLETLLKSEKKVNAIIELWLPYFDSIEKTIIVQDDWIEKSIKYLKQKIESVFHARNL